MERNFVSQLVLQETNQSKIFHRNKGRILHKHMNVSYNYLTDLPSYFWNRSGENNAIIRCDVPQTLCSSDYPYEQHYTWETVLDFLLFGLHRQALQKIFGFESLQKPSSGLSLMSVRTGSNLVMWEGCKDLTSPFCYQTNAILHDCCPLVWFLFLV